MGKLKPGKETAEILNAIAGELTRRIASIRLKKLNFETLTKTEMNQEIQIPGMPNWWLMPIQTRIGMITTGMKGTLGLKVRGSDLKELQRVSVELEQTLKEAPGTLSVVAERAMGGHYLDIEILRKECARYGLTIKNVQDVIESAIGGINVTTTVEGRYRFPINVRYPRELRDDVEKLKRILVFTPRGEHIPLFQLANIKESEGPPVVKSENGLLLTTIPVELEQGWDIGTYVKSANQVIEQAMKKEQVRLPAGYYINWSGQFEFMEKVNQRLKAIIPITLILIFLLLYFNFGRLTETLIVMISLPFAVVGGIWMMWILGYNMSVASGVGFIATAGIAAETGILMLVYLNLAYKNIEGSGPMAFSDLRDAVSKGAILRVRPILMTVVTTIFALLPIMWSTGAGSQTMKRMATPMIGGLISATILTLIVIPVVYLIAKERELQREKKIA